MNHFSGRHYIHSHGFAKLTGRDWPHRTSHNIFASLSIYVKFFIFNVQFDERQPRVQVISTMQISGVHARISWRLYIAGLEAAIPEYPLTI